MNETIKRILVPVAFSDNCERAVAEALALARTHGAEVRLFHVVEANPQNLPLLGVSPAEALAYAGDASLLADPRRSEVPRDRIGDALHRLEHIAAEARDVKVTVDASAGDALREILAEIAHYRPDLVVMPSHQRKGLAHWLRGSVTAGVMRQAPVQVMALPIGAEAA